MHASKYGFHYSTGLYRGHISFRVVNSLVSKVFSVGKLTKTWDDFNCLFIIPCDLSILDYIVLYRVLT